MSLLSPQPQSGDRPVHAGCGALLGALVGLVVGWRLAIAGVVPHFAWCIAGGAVLVAGLSAAFGEGFWPAVLGAVRWLQALVGL